MSFNFEAATDAEVLQEAFRRAENTPGLFSSSPTVGYKGMTITFDNVSVTLYINESQLPTLAGLMAGIQPS